MNEPIVSNESPRRSLTVQLSSLMIVDDSLSYGKLPSQNLTLSVLKLDSSSFQVEVAKTATVAELKDAVEAVFRPEKISWPLVWGQFCLCYDAQKLVTETDYLRDYGIKDGDQLQFVRHISNVCSIQRKPKKRTVNLNQHGRCRSSSQVNRYQQKENVDANNISLDSIVIENGKVQNCNAEENRVGMGKLTGYLGGMFSEARMAVVRRARMEGGISRGIASSFRKVKGIVGQCRKPHKRNTWKEFSS
ncbi:uncharacterized protein LOC131660626 isoform X1 [Vicia villosa]|uniref:uncharacterized protein LOC131660626 isoform X1 n=1 Tax=Vicia villosa TaxID=3911 RepID=UPI00273B86B4|nr:uncharacterized protein LOC131660626 isoform X1 [Vicia villosa]